MEGPRLQISAGMHFFLEYPKFVGTTRMLILETQYFFDQSWVRAAKTLGWEAVTVPSAMIGSLGREPIRQLFTTLAEFQPHFILASNYAGMDAEGVFARFFEDIKIPYVTWFTDTPRTILYGRNLHVSHYSVAATWERAYIGHLQRLGFPHVHFMPLATDPHLFHGTPPAAYERELAFVGVSMTQQANERIERLAHLPHLLDAVRNAFDENRVTRERFAEGITAILDADLLNALRESERRDVELLIHYEGMRRQRMQMAHALAPLGLQVRGDAGWLQSLSNVQGPVGYFDDLASFYRNTAVNVNSTSLQMRYAVNQRVFDCPAAGGFLITDNQSDLMDFFDVDREVVLYQTLDDLKEKAEYYLARPEARKEIVQRAQARIAAHHTHAHRLKALEAFLKERYA